MQEKVADIAAGSNYVPPSRGGNEIIPKGPPTEGNPAEGRPDANPTNESYTAKGPLTSDQWKEKVSKYNESIGKKPKKPKKEAEQTPAPAVEPVAEEPPAPNAEEPAEQPVEEGEEPPQEGAAAQEGEEVDPTKATPQPKFKVEPKFTAVGKQYELPKYLADAITTPEQEKEVKDLYTKAMGLDHVKMRHQELTDKHVGLQNEHTELTDGIAELSEIYQEAVRTQNPLLLNHFFEQLQIPHQVILQYAQSLAQFYESDPASQQQILGSLEAHRRARVAGRQNQRLTQGNQQAQVQARTMELESALARPEIATPVQQFEQKFGPGSFKQELIRNGIYVFQTEKRDISIAENVNQVLTRFGLTAQAAPGTPAAGAPQAPAAAPAQPAQSPSPAPAPQAQTPVVPVQPHRKVPVIPAVNGKSSTSPMKQAPKSIEDIKKIRKQKFGH